MPFDDGKRDEERHNPDEDAIAPRDRCHMEPLLERPKQRDQLEHNRHCQATIECCAPPPSALPDGFVITAGSESAGPLHHHQRTKGNSARISFAVRVIIHTVEP